MRASGLVMVIAGVWIGCQLWAGEALQRLNLTPGPPAAEEGGD